MYKKGYAFERLLKLELEKDGWKVIRSGGSKKPDIIAGRDGKVIVIECKSSKYSRIYIDKKEVENLKEVAGAFHAECMFAVHINRKRWFMISPDNMKETKNSYSIELKD